MGMKARRTLYEWDGYVKVYVGRVRAADHIGALKAIARRAENQLRWTATPGQQAAGAIIDTEARSLKAD